MGCCKEREKWVSWKVSSQRQGFVGPLHLKHGLKAELIKDLLNDERMEKKDREGE